MTYRFDPRAFEPLLGFWFPTTSYQNFWFSTSRDHEVRSLFGKLLEDVSRLSFEDIKQIVNTHNQSVHLLLSIVIVLDQFTRNLHRSDSPEDIDKRASNDRLVMQLLEHYQNIITAYGFENLHHVIFFLLPYRHRGTPEDLRYCVSKINEIKTFLDTNPDPVKQKIFKHFCKATFMQIASTPEFFRAETHIPTGGPLHMSQHLHVLDENCGSGHEEYIGWDPRTRPPTDNTPLISSIRAQVSELDITRPCVSLSGGVDSITIFFIFLMMLEKGEITHLSAVYSHCGDRKEMEDERIFLIGLCSSFNVPLRIVYARFGTDCIVDRGVFDAATRDARFEAYRYCMKHFGSTHVFFGHHLGDRIENIVNNAKKHVLLDHTRPFSTICGVNICRPYYLTATKPQIFEFATTHGLPYFRNTTSEGSTRWEIRTNMVPLLDAGDPNAWRKFREIVEGENIVVESERPKTVYDYAERVVSASKEVADKKAAEMASAEKLVVSYANGFQLPVHAIPEPILRQLLNKQTRTTLKQPFWDIFLKFINDEKRSRLFKFSEQFMTCFVEDVLFFVDLKYFPGRSKQTLIHRDALSDPIWTIAIAEEEKSEFVAPTPASFLNGRFNIRFPTCECKKTLDDPKYANSVYALGLMFSCVPRVLCGGRPCNTPECPKVVFSITYTMNRLPPFKRKR
jgi:tRNA(Ile)-lysidine synthase TilS/MesJ/uncharacterized protein (DUF924 family)